MPIPLLALAISAFAIGTTEFVIMGLLPEVAHDLAVSIPSAGLLVSGYALGVAVGAPLLAVLTSKMPRKLALQLLMGVFIVGNTLCAIASSYSVLMIARVVTSFAHGSFFGIGAVVAASLVPAEKRASAIALMFTGLTLANVLGVPFGTFIGQQFGWRAAFWIVSALGVLSLAGVTALVPNRHDAGPLGLGHEVRVLKDPQVWTALAMTVLGFGGVFVVFTYIAPILEQVSGFSPRGVTLILVLFGVGLTIGNTVGGKLADRALMELRWQDAYHQFNTAENEQQLFHQVSAYSKRLGFEYCCYGIRVPQPGSQPLVEIFDTYPPGWMAHYQARNYIEIDPTVRDGAASPNMIIWPDADAAEQPSLWRDARDFGMSVGVAQSSWAARGVFGLLTIARRSDRLTPAEINSLTLQANWLANLSHSLMGRFLVPKLSPAASISLTKREREVLSWTSEGRTASEIGEQLNISERTVTFHINNILAKLGAANKVQAVVKAIGMGLIQAP